MNKYFDVIRTENGFQNTHIKLIAQPFRKPANLLNNLLLRTISSKEYSLYNHPMDRIEIFDITCEKY